MGLSIVPVFERSFRSPIEEFSGEILGASLEALEEIAEENGLPPLSGFADSREIPEGFEGDPDELKEIMGPSTDWYDSGEGARSLEALKSLLATRPELAQRVDDPQDVVGELDDLVKCLKSAASEGIRFRLDLL